MVGVPRFLVPSFPSSLIPGARENRPPTLITCPGRRPRQHLARRDSTGARYSDKNNEAADPEDGEGGVVQAGARVLRESLGYRPGKPPRCPTRAACRAESALAWTLDWHDALRHGRLPSDRLIIVAGMTGPGQIDRGREELRVLGSGGGASKPPASAGRIPGQASLIRASNSSADIFPLISAPSRRLSARSRFEPCRPTIFSSMVSFITSR